MAVLHFTDGPFAVDLDVVVRVSTITLWRQTTGRDFKALLESMSMLAFDPETMLDLLWPLVSGPLNKARTDHGLTPYAKAEFGDKLFGPLMESAVSALQDAASDFSPSLGRAIQAVNSKMNEEFAKLNANSTNSVGSGSPTDSSGSSAVVPKTGA